MVYLLICFLKWISDGPGTSDVTEEIVGQNKAHPKVYVGFFSHSAFAYKCDSCRHTDAGEFQSASLLALATQTANTISLTYATPVNQGAATEYIANQEYRSNDWWRLPRGEDMHLWSEIDGKLQLLPLRP